MCEMIQTMTCLAQDDYEGVAEALITMGATRGNVDKRKFGAELREVLEKIASMQPQVVITANQISGKRGPITISSECC